jgi:hypothetical protein
MSSNALAISGDFSVLSEGSDASALLEANLGNGASLRSKDLNWVKIPTGGATRWSWTTKSGNEFSEKAITGLLVVVGRVEQALWPHTTATNESKPLLVSTDGVRAFKTGTDYGDLDPNVIEAAKNEDGSYAVSKIHYFQWEGRGPGSKPPRAKSSRVLGVLREGEPLPVFIRVSSTSLRAVDDLLRGITSDGVFHWQSVVELSLEKKKGAKADYAVLVGKKIGAVDREIGLRAKALFTDKLTEVVAPLAESRITVHGTSEATSESASTDAVPF